MPLYFDALNWPAIGVCAVVGQVYLTLWFAVIFAKPWAKAYGVDDPKEHTRQVPAYTYGIGLVCVVALTLGLALLQAGAGVNGIGDGLGLGLFVALPFCAATAIPGYAFLRRWSACALAVGSQATLIVVLSTILAAWPR